MTFRDLQKVVQSQPSSEPNQLLQSLRGKSFWYWDQNRHKEKDRVSKGECCFNHIVGLPRKDGTEKPIFDYEKLLYNALLEPGYLNSVPKSKSHPNYLHNVMYPFKEKHLWIKKATGLGVTEFMLRFMAWLWSKDEYDVSNIPFRNRGKRADEFIQVLKRIWTDDVVEFKGEYYSIPASKIGPKPIQKPHIPIYLGGFSPNTF